MKDDIGSTTMQALQLLWLVKKHILGSNGVDQHRNQACSFYYYYQELIIVEGECLTLYRAVKHDSEKFKGIQSDVLK